MDVRIIDGYLIEHRARDDIHGWYLGLVKYPHRAPPVASNFWWDEARSVNPCEGAAEDDTELDN